MSVFEKPLSQKPGANGHELGPKKYPGTLPENPQEEESVPVREKPLPNHTEEWVDGEPPSHS